MKGLKDWIGRRVKYDGQKGTLRKLREDGAAAQVKLDNEPYEKWVGFERLVLLKKKTSRDIYCVRRKHLQPDNGHFNYTADDPLLPGEIVRVRILKDKAGE